MIKKISKNHQKFNNLFDQNDLKFLDMGSGGGGGPHFCYKMGARSGPKFPKFWPGPTPVGKSGKLIHFFSELAPIL